MRKKRILGIPGSLSEGSANYAILNRVAALLGNEIDFSIYNGGGQLPHFNPQIDLTPAPPEVEKLRHALAAADGVIICTPEYAFGVPGSLKNALDWTVSSGEFVHKPLALITASLSGEKAQAALLLTFTALSADIVPETTLLLSFIRSKLDEKGDFKSPDDLAAVKKLLDSLVSRLT